MSEYRMILVWWEATVRAFMGDRVRNQLGEVPEKVIISAVFAAGAIAIGGIIVAKFTTASNKIPTGP